MFWELSTKLEYSAMLIFLTIRVRGFSCRCVVRTMRNVVLIRICLYYFKKTFPLTAWRSSGLGCPPRNAFKRQRVRRNLKDLYMPKFCNMHSNSYFLIYFDFYVHLCEIAHFRLSVPLMIIKLLRWMVY